MNNTAEKSKIYIRALKLISPFFKRVKKIGFFPTLLEWVSYVRKYNKILKKNNSYSFKYGLIHCSFYLHIVDTFPDIEKEKILNFIPYTLTYAVFIKNKINRSKHTFDKLTFYQKAIENDISIPFTYGYTDENSAIHYLMGDERFLSENIQNKNVIGKPRKANSGTGVFQINQWSDLNIPEYIIQQKAVDHSAISTLTASKYCSTVRVALYNKEGEASIMAAHIRLNAGTIVDHLFSGSLYADVDVSTGKVKGFGVDNKSNKFYKHPVSGIDIDGFQIPYWDKVSIEAQKVCKTHKELPLIGLDVVITNNGPVILEINGGFHTFGLQFNKTLFEHEVFKNKLSL